MSRLDEIEVWVTSEDGKGVWIDADDARLLIRAVRQLGAWRNLEVTDNPDVVNINPVKVDPDVLELLEEA